MTEPAISISKPKKVAETLADKPPRLNERILVGSYQNYQLDDLREHASVILKCGLTAEVVAKSGMTTLLFAARRRGRNKHD